MDDGQRILAERRTSSEATLEELRHRLESTAELKDVPQLAIYATGSYGRREASPHSDLDLFFVSEGPEVGNIHKTLLDAALIRLTRELGLPEFSGDGRWLQIHRVEEMIERLGTPRDDFENFFTARLLLLLESVPLCHNEAYEAILRRIVETYFRDFAGHESDFRPVFLLNDLLRFWRTICLNYESGRPLGEDQKIKMKTRVKNLKLKFSRSFTCFSTVMHLVSEPGGTSPDMLLEVVARPPAERVQLAAEKLDKGGELASEALNRYSWFLDLTDQAPSNIVEWISHDENHKMAMEQADAFGGTLYRIVSRLAEQAGVARYLVI